MLKLYNTLTRKKEEFKPLSKSGLVKMYSCGPTVYNYAHIGNMRTYIFMDILRRTLKFEGYKLKGVMNITDVGHLTSDGDTGEDKMQQAAEKLQKSPYEIAEIVTVEFFKDLARLNIGKPEIIVKATDHIADMLDYVIKLCELGYGYETPDGIYFDIAKFPGYGKLSGIKLDEQKAGARVEVNEYKRNASDFALWKKAEPEHIMQWDSPWGKGYPGWHIECSAMSSKYLGKLFDIHTGGVDHIPIHHENEIAQSEALEGKKTVNTWMHGEFMLFDNGKMSKSLGNTYRVAELAEKGYPPMAFRFFCLNAHYRKRLNFTFEGLAASATAYERLLAGLYQHKISAERAPKAVLDKYAADFSAAISDDLNIPYALGLLFTMLKESKSKDIYALALRFDGVFALDLDKAAASGVAAPENFDIPEEITALAEKRVKAKALKDFAGADALRKEIADKGYTVIDVPGGYKINK
ncbi:MAG: cysteine--tRNA ligase [Clostridiales bacterium]|jgi:cysteinyl-tRNA synthetase|nr:cysteine--tRNA ligase [Clostridiales bacterium]